MQGSAARAVMLSEFCAPLVCEHTKFGDHDENATY